MILERKRRAKLKEKKRVVNPNKAKAGEPRAPKQKTRMSCLGFELWGDGGGALVYRLLTTKIRFGQAIMSPLEIRLLHSTYIIVLSKEFSI